MFAVAGAAYTALALILTFPLMLHLGSVVPHDTGDPMLSTAILWWNAHVPWFTSRWWNGFAFYPSPGFMAFSDPRLGESLMATPLQWLGCSPVTAYNLTLLATYPLSALAAHWLGVVVTKRHDAGAICGLAYEFYPFRVAHIPHLELLAAFGMPAALAALHRYLETRRRGWLAVFAAALVVQGLCSSYYLLLFSVLLVLWLLWFVRGDIGALTGIVVAAGCAFVALTPLALGYSRIHAYYGFSRQLREIVKFSADLTSLFTTSPYVLLWGWTSRWAKSEGELFPGATIAVLAILGALLAWRRAGDRDRLDRFSWWLLPAAAVFAAIAACGWAFAPWKLAFAGLRLSSDAPYKPMTLALLALVGWLGASSRMRGAYARRSTFAFYALAAAVLFLCSFGPKPAAAGHQFLYEPPYAWLMRLSIFSSIRVPARFGMPAMLALAMTGALAFHRLHLRPPARRALAAALMIGVVADGWIRDMPLPKVPDVWDAARAEGFDAVLELPLGNVMDDLTAMYRVVDHGHPVVNGNSGFAPTSYGVVRTAFQDHDPAALDGLPPATRILVVVDRQHDTSGGWQRFLEGHPRVTRLAPDPRWAFYAVQPPPADPLTCGGPSIPIVAIADADGGDPLKVLTDADPQTWWATRHPQRAGDHLQLDFGAAVHPCAVTLGVGPFLDSYPRQMVIDTSMDGVIWTTIATRRTAGMTMRAAIADPRHVSISIPLVSNAARYVRLRLEESHPNFPWIVTDVAVTRASGAE
jgi:hypothetical protein